MHGKRNLGGVDDGLDVHRGQIVAIQIDVEDADRDRALLQRLDLSRQPLRQRHAAAPDADEGQLVQIVAFFQNFMRQPDQRAVDFRRTHQLSFFPRESHMRDTATGYHSELKSERLQITRYVAHPVPVTTSMDAESQIKFGSLSPSVP